MKLKFGVLAILLVVIVMLSLIANLPDAKLLGPRIGSKLISNTQKTPSSSLSKLHPVKIISPIRGQQVSIGKNLTISGISIANATSHCQVSVRVN
jgi:hypothetical protein